MSSPIMTPQDMTEIARMRARVVGDRPSSLVLRRNETSLTSQTVRLSVVKLNASNYKSEAGAENRTGMLVSGEPDLDIAVNDRFSVNGQVYRVIFVLPNRDTGTQAEAELAE